MSEKFEDVKYFCEQGFWSEEKLESAVAKGWITEEEYKEILNETKRIS